MAEISNTTHETVSRKNRRALLGGAVGFTSLMLVVAGCGYNSKPKSSAVNPETKAKLTATIEPTAVDIAKQVLEFRKYNRKLTVVENDKYNPGKNRKLVYIQSFGSYDMFNVYVGMLVEKGRLDPNTVYDVDVFRDRRGYNNDYGTPHNATQEVELYRGTDADGTSLWGATDEFTPAGNTEPTIHVGTDFIGSDLANPDLPVSPTDSHQAIEVAKVWSGVEQAVIDEALAYNGSITATINPHF